MTEQQVYEYLASYGKSGRPVENLKRAGALLEALGNPQDSLKFIHVAGTNGNGSICEMLTEILCAQGYRVGTFTSPYILEYSDRIRVNKKNIAAHYLIRHAEKVKKAAEKTPYGNDYSQFEITMCIALLHFAERACDVVVLETGIGGLNDCTNVIASPLVSIIGSVSYDHTAVLGDTLEQISAQKAGIIKEGCPAILSYGNEECVEQVFRRTAICRHSHLTIPLRSGVNILSDELSGCEFTYKGRRYKTAMCGAHQVQNAVSVIEALSAVRYSLPVSGENIALGISRASLHARTEIISQDPLIILDGGHNPDGFSALSEVLEGKTKAPRAALVGMLEGKNAVESLNKIIPLCNLFLTVDSFHRGAIDSRFLANEIGDRGGNAIAVGRVSEGYDRLMALKDSFETGVICGSLYLASEVYNSLPLR